MFREKEYTIMEMREITGTKDRQGIREKLNNYAIEFDESGWGKTVVFNIKNIPDKFKAFCVIDLKVPAQTDFKKLKCFLYYFFCDETFAQIPDEAKAERLKKDKNDISRQTIAKYIARLDTLNLISKNTDNYVYYFASGNYRENTTKETYSKAWKEYWQNKSNGYSTADAINEMRYNYGGVARKYPIPEWNGIYLEEINYIIDLVCESIENELPE